MGRNYLAFATRSLAKNRIHSFINIAGLAIGMAACLMILLFVRYERSYDRWLPNVKNTYQFQAWYPSPKDGTPLFLQMSAYVSGQRLKKDFPQIEDVVFLVNRQPFVVKDGQAMKTEHHLFTDGDFLGVVNLPLLRGGRDALARSNSAVITQSEAIRRYGTDSVLGQTLSVVSMGTARDFQITGVLKDLPKNSHMQVDAIMRVDFATFMAKYPEELTCWGCQSGWIYAKLRPETDPDVIIAGLPAWKKRNIPDENVGTAHFNQGDEQDWHLINVQDVHLGQAQSGAMRAGNDRRTLVAFSIVAMLILCMAVVNFTNLATARASQRAREVALRKVLGASRRQLIARFMGESLVMAAVAMLLALALIELFVPPFAAFLGADLRLSFFGREGIVLPAIALLLVVGGIGGLYPALLLSRFKPAAILKANQSTAETPGSGRLRAVLVVAQFAISIGLIICTLVIHSQTRFARSVDPGYQRDHILQVNNLSRVQLSTKGDAMVAMMKRVPGVRAVGRTSIGIATDETNNVGILVPGVAKPVNIGEYHVDAGFMNAMGLELRAGRWFDDSRPMDDMTLSMPDEAGSERALAARGVNVVMNETAVRKLGYKTPDEAIGKTLSANLFSAEIGLVPLTIVGVVKDSRFRSVRTPVEPLFLENVRTRLPNLLIRYEGEPAAVHASVEAAWRSITHDVPFEAKFSEDIVRDLYQADDARAKVFAFFAVLAVIVGCLGLFGLAAFTVERRTKEIGIRKVLGARTRDIVLLLVWQFSRPVVIANILAWPVTWWLMRDWLNGFDARIDLGLAPFIAAAGIAMAIAVVTVAGHAIRIARVNPIHALRYE